MATQAEITKMGKELDNVVKDIQLQLTAWKNAGDDISKSKAIQMLKKLGKDKVLINKKLDDATLSLEKDVELQLKEHINKVLNNIINNEH
jgi:hypothetical protein